MVLALIALFACKKEEKTVSNLEFIKTTPGGCAVSGTRNVNDSLMPDTVTWHIQNDSLTIHVRFIDACCRNFKTDASVSNDTIYMNIIAIPGPVCGCICDYEYDFLFTGISHPYYYFVNINDYKHMTGYIKP